MEAFHPPKEIKETVDDSDLPEKEGISEKSSLLEAELLPLLHEKNKRLKIKTKNTDGKYFPPVFLLVNCLIKFMIWNTVSYNYSASRSEAEMPKPVATSLRTLVISSVPRVL